MLDVDKLIHLEVIQTSWNKRLLFRGRCLKCLLALARSSHNDHFYLLIVFKFSYLILKSDFRWAGVADGLYCFLVPISPPWTSELFLVPLRAPQADSDLCCRMVRWTLRSSRGVWPSPASPAATLVSSVNASTTRSLWLLLSGQKRPCINDRAGWFPPCRLLFLTGAECKWLILGPRE